MYNNEAVVFNNYYNELGCNYFKDRGISSDTIELFKLGLLDSNTDISNVINISDGFGLSYVFPLFDIDGNVISFALRRNDSNCDIENTVKYKNGHNTDIYYKSNYLYGLNFALEYIKKTSCVYIVEGYMDLLSLWEYGIKNVVCICGTSFTNGHLSVLKNFATKFVLFFDNDKSGGSASLKSIDLLITNEVTEIEVITYNSECKDPSDCFLSGNLTATINSSIKYVNYLHDCYINSSDLMESARIGSKFYNEIKSFLFVDIFNYSQVDLSCKYDGLTFFDSRSLVLLKSINSGNYEIFMSTINDIGNDYLCDDLKTILSVYDKEIPNEYKYDVVLLVVDIMVRYIGNLLNNSILYNERLLVYSAIRKHLLKFKTDYIEYNRLNI